MDGNGLSAEENYRVFCKNEPTIPIFLRDWWLDAVAPNQWDVVAVMHGDKSAALMPYVKKKHKGFTLITQPPLTQFLGPWLRQSNAKYTKQLSKQKRLMNELIEGLPRAAYFAQNFSYLITNWLPFYWKGFQQSTRYTYVLDNLYDIDRIWADFSESTRRSIRKAQKLVSVRCDLGIDKFLDVHTLTFHRQRQPLPYSREFVINLDTACNNNKARRIFFAEDAQGKIHAVVYIIWDSNSAYYLMGGGDPELRTSGATSLIMFEAIKFAATVTKRFDFEGSMIEPIERFFRGFGAKQVPYFSISKINSRFLNLMLSSKKILFR